ncbi:hypothetical protein F3Y22_tig00111028pilonHSYRG00029 [Hibiscus syriacus]|uniref:Uncharacterized protein n=1 Tax=Hibiscus syriacus TaxID=106335 RepID=A0A6A2Z6J8_HIBSY|nr:hypothetical protein F3Y22_tig00111028pilonHSYRG00029 [Hibiscus syriacus]
MARSGLGKRRVVEGKRVGRRSKGPGLDKKLKPKAVSQESDTRNRLRKQIKTNLVAAASGRDLEETGSEDDGLLDLSNDDFFLSRSSSEWTESTRYVMHHELNCSIELCFLSDGKGIELRFTWTPTPVIVDLESAVSRGSRNYLCPQYYPTFPCLLRSEGHNIRTHI